MHSQRSETLLFNLYFSLQAISWLSIPNLECIFACSLPERQRNKTISLSLPPKELSMRSYLGQINSYFRQ